MQYDELREFLRDAEQRILRIITASDVSQHFKPEDISESAFAYVERPAKRLRPAVLLMAAGALGGAERERLAEPAAAGVELFHSWTLVHDDLIDNDAMRRGGPTIHTAAAAKARSRDGFPVETAAEYGRDIGVLTGDIQHGWSVALFIDCALNGEVNPILILKLVRHLQSYVLGNLIRGEVLDVRYGMHTMAELEEIDEDRILEMLWLKTGVLYAFAGMAGALIGENTIDFDTPSVRAIQQFSSKCGTAFQLQDDILGIVGDESALGKPVGSDIREGKKTVIVYESIKNATELERKTILSTLGNRSASAREVQAVAEIFRERKGIERTKSLASRFIQEALPHLEIVPDSRYKRLLLLWAHYMLDREF